MTPVLLYEDDFKSTEGREDDSGAAYPVLSTQGTSEGTSEGMSQTSETTRLPILSSTDSLSESKRASSSREAKLSETWTDSKYHQDVNTIDDSKNLKEDDIVIVSTSSSVPAAATVKGSSRKNSSAWYARLELAVVIGCLCVFGAVIVFSVLFFTIFRRKGTNSFDVQVRLLCFIFCFEHFPYF